MIKLRDITLAAFILLFLSNVGALILSVHAQEQSGSIVGVVVDAGNGESLIGANVSLADTTVGAQTDLDGRFEIRPLQPGVYDIRISYIGFQTTQVEDIAVASGEASRIEVDLQSTSQGLGELIVQAEAARNSEAGLLRSRQKAAAVSDAISSEAMSRAGNSTAADAMARVTGATVSDGRYVQIRGLSGRYMNTQLNGADLPSADPDVNSVPLDLFPSNLLDNIVTTKSFTPDQPGSFTGGSVNIGSKSFPEQLTVSFSSSVSYNDTYGESSLPIPNGSTRQVPALLNEPLPNYVAAQRDEALARQLDEQSRAFSTPFTFGETEHPVDQSYSLAFGNRFMLGGRPLGVVATGTFSRSFDGYTSGFTGRYRRPGDVSQADRLHTEVQLNDLRGSREDLIGSLLSLSFRPHVRHMLGITLMHNRSTTDEARIQTGEGIGPGIPDDRGSDGIFQTRRMGTSYRSMTALQTHGEHAFTQSGALRLVWNGSVARTAQDDPDLRFFASDYVPGNADTTYNIRVNNYPRPARYFRELEEQNASVDAHLTVPVRSKTSIKIGGRLQQRDRRFRERIFQYRMDAGSFDGNTHRFFSEDVGLNGQDENGRYRFGNYLLDTSIPRNNYDGTEKVTAGFAMLDAMPFRNLRVVTGLRYEHTDLSVVSVNAPNEGAIRTGEWLPALNLTYAIQSSMNLRLAYGRTLARPSFREFAPFVSFDFIGDFLLVGNPDLRQTQTDNLDLRWEWFVRPGEIVAASGFVKYFHDPIERTANIEAPNPEYQYRNVEHARVYGIELEARKRLGQVHRLLQHLELGANLTLAQSQVSITPKELQLIHAVDPDASSTRNLQGQSPYVVNLDAHYMLPDWGASITAIYNIFGPRLQTVAGGGAPDLYERPRHVVDLLVNQQIGWGIEVNASVKNLLNSEYRVSQIFKEQPFINEQYSKGREFSLGLRYTL